MNSFKKNGLEIIFTEVIGKNINKDSIFIDTVFMNSYVTQSNVLARFNRPKSCLRHANLSMTYHDLIKKETQLNDAYESLKHEITKHQGCLFTAFSDKWKELMVDLLVNHKTTVYAVSLSDIQTVYKCELA